jgi:hypothetical protein
VCFCIKRPISKQCRFKKHSSASWHSKKKVELLLNDHPRALFIAARYFGLDAANSLVYYHHAATKGFLRANYYLRRHYHSTTTILVLKVEIILADM